MTTQEPESFDRTTGVGEDCWLDSTARLPPEIYDTLIGLDRRYGASNSEEAAKLTTAEKHALLFIADFYPAHPLPQE